MKCLQSIVNAEIVMVDDDKADRMIGSKSWFAVPKRLWVEKQMAQLKKEATADHDWQPVTAMTADLEQGNE